MKIQLLHTKDCHVWMEAENQLKLALEEAGLKTNYETVLIESQGKAEKYRFSGSPQIVIDGEDIDPMAKNIKNFSIASCRPYFYQGESFDFPPKEMILEQLNKRR